MTVKSLVKWLESMPQDAQVILHDTEGYFDESGQVFGLAEIIQLVKTKPVPERDGLLRITKRGMKTVYIGLEDAEV